MRFEDRINHLIHEGEKLLESKYQPAFNAPFFVKKSNFLSWHAQATSFLENILSPDNTYFVSFKSNVRSQFATDVETGIQLLQTIANEYQAGRLLLESQSNDSPNNEPNDAHTHAFISYKIEDKYVARRIKDILAKIGIESFLAHEDIKVSDEWRLRILSEIGRANLFIPLLSENFYNSTWCIQELGIASFRKEMTVIPLSIDENIPQGFSSNIQSTRIDPESFTLTDLLPGIAKHDVALAIDIMIEIIASSRSFREAEANFRLILPYLNQASDDQIKLLLEKVADNGQVHQAAQCANEYIPPLLESHGHLLDNDTRSFLTETLGKS